MSKKSKKPEQVEVPVRDQWREGQPELAFTPPAQGEIYPPSVLFRRYEQNPLGEKRMIDEKMFALVALDVEPDGPEKDTTLDTV